MNRILLVLFILVSLLSNPLPASPFSDSLEEMQKMIREFKQISNPRVSASNYTIEVIRSQHTNFEKAKDRPLNKPIQKSVIKFYSQLDSLLNGPEFTKCTVTNTVDQSQLNRPSTAIDAECNAVFSF